MNCQQANELLIEYLDGRLDADRRAQVESHLATCVACRERVAEFRALSALLEEWQPEGPSPAFDTRLAERIESSTASWRPAWLQPAYLAVVAAVVLIVVGLMLWSRPGIEQRSAVAVKTTPAAPQANVQAREPQSELSQEERIQLLENLAVLENAQTLEDLDVLSEMGPPKAKKKL